jgi:hypothetical protein
MKLSSQFRFWLRVAIKAAVIFSPLLLVGCYLIRFEHGGGEILKAFNEIRGNSYFIDDVLLAFIVASYVVVVIGLILYFVEIVNDLGGYSGSKKLLIERLNGIAITLLVFVAAALVLYLGLIVLACVDLCSIPLPAFVLINRWLSLGIFSCFLVSDVLMWRSQSLQKAENTAKLTSTDAKETALRDELSKEIEKNGRYREFSKLSTFLINMPAIVLSGSTIMLIWYLEIAHRFRGVVDATLHGIEIPGAVRLDTFSLFLHGVEAGIITATIIFSQIVYLGLKTKCEWRAETAAK